MNEEKVFYQQGQVKLQKRPKLRISRLVEEKKIVSINVDIQINEKLIIRERFDWRLDDTTISPSLFAEKFCSELNLPEPNRENIKNQIMMQLIDHIEKNTFFPRNRTGKQYDNVEASQFSDFKFDGSQAKEEDGDGQQKQTERQKILEEMKKKSSTQSKSLVFDTKKECKYCKTQQIATTECCRNCKMPFKFIDKIGQMNERELLSLKFLDSMIKQIDVIADSELEKLLDWEDMQSAYYLKNIIVHKLSQTDEVKTQDILEDLINAVNSVYEEFISVDRFEGNKEKAREESSDDDESSKKEDAIKTKVIRKRGRPKKFLIPKKFMLKKPKLP